MAYTSKVSYLKLSIPTGIDRLWLYVAVAVHKRYTRQGHKPVGLCSVVCNEGPSRSPSHRLLRLTPTKQACCY